LKKEKKRRIIDSDFSKKRKKTGGVFILLILFAVWFMLNGRFDADVWIAGVPLCLLVWGLFLKLAGMTVRRELKAMKLIPSLFLYGLLLLREIVKANFAVLGVIWRGETPDSCYVSFHSGLKTQKANALLANSITLTPGTITVLQEGDAFTVHCLKKAYGEDMENMCFVKALERMEKKWNR